MRVVRASAARRCELPIVGTIELPAAVIVRPDGHVAWTGELTDPQLPVALTRWFGPR